MVQAFEVLPEPSGPAMRMLCELPVKIPRPSRGHGLLSVIAKTNGYEWRAPIVSKSDPPSLRSAPGEGMGRGAGHTARAWEGGAYPAAGLAAPPWLCLLAVLRLCGCAAVRLCGSPLLLWPLRCPLDMSVGWACGRARGRGALREGPSGMGD